MGGGLKEQVLVIVAFFLAFFLVRQGKAATEPGELQTLEVPQQPQT
jgi:hypothetical protein